MERRVLAVAVLAALAGCGGFAGGQTPTETVSPAPVPSVPSTSESPADRLAPGLSARGVTDVDRLAAAHVDAVVGTSYRWTATDVREARDSDATVTEHSRIVVENETVYRRQIEFSEAYGNGLEFTRSLGVYADGRYEYRSWITKSLSERRYRRSPSPNRTPAFADYVARAIRRYLPLAESRVVRVPRGNATYYRVVGTGAPPSISGRVSNYTARALVRADGFVETIDVAYETDRDDERVRVRYDFTYSDVGSATVTPPEWLPEAREAVHV